MARTHLTDKQIRAPYNKANAVAWKAKLDDLDDVADTVEAGGSAVLSQIHHVRGVSTGAIANLAAFTVANDDVTLAAGDRVLVKDQADAKHNGIYVVGTVATGTAPLTRATDWDTATELKQGTLVHVAEGTAGSNTYWQITGDFPATVGTTHQHFVAQWTTTAVLTADGPGRALMADDFLDAATVARVVDAKAIDTGSIADSAIEALQIDAAAVTEPKVAPSILTGKHVAVGAAGATTGIVPNLFVIAVPDGNTVLDALTLNATYGKIQIVDAWYQKNTVTGGAADAVQVTIDAGGADPVTSSLALNAIETGGIVRATQIIAAKAAFAAGAHIYVKRTKTTDNGGTLFLTAYRVA
jgi:hypothetical protein